MSAVLIDEVARLPAPGDNVAIATQRLEAGTRRATAPRMTANPAAAWPKPINSPAPMFKSVDPVALDMMTRPEA